MYKSNTTWRKLYTLCCLNTRPQNGGGGGRLFEGGGANSRIYGIAFEQGKFQPKQ